jgi:galactonate dehydratase
MKITNIEPYLVWSGNANYMFVVVDTDEGISGVGEAGLRSRMLAVASCIEHLKLHLIGEDPMRTEHLSQVMYRADFFPAGNIGASAAAAIDIALWDIKGKALGLPVYELLGGRVRDRVVCYPHNVGHAMEIEPLVESCLRSKEEGWKFVRWGLPQDGTRFEPAEAIRAGLRQLEAVRKAIGDEIEICFDVHTRLDPADAVYFCRAAEPYRPFFVEDPIRAESMYSLRHVRQHTNVPIAVGEQFCSKWEFRQVIEEELTDYARIDVCIAGGLTEAKKIAAMAEAHYIKVATHNPLGPVSTAACLHLNLTIPNFGVMEQPRRPGTMLTDVVPVQVEWQDGYLLPPQRPGLGVEFDREAARRSPYQPRRGVRLTRDDGSFTNW